MTKRKQVQILDFYRYKLTAGYKRIYDLETFDDLSELYYNIALDWLNSVEAGLILLSCDIYSGESNTEEIVSLIREDWSSFKSCENAYKKHSKVYFK